VSPVLTPPPPPDLAAPRRTRARLVLAGIAVLVVVVLVVAVAFLIGSSGSSAPNGAAAGAPNPGPAPGGTTDGSGPAGSGPAGGGPGSVAGTAGDPAAGGWDVAAETAIATAPMVALPDSAVLPHALASTSAGELLRLPAATQTVGRWVPGGFPDTPEGALAQLAALTTAGFAGLDPQTYIQAYTSVAWPGAPDPAHARLATDMQRFLAQTGLAATGAAPQLTVTYQPAQGLIKGTADHGQYVVACVLGDLIIEANAQNVSSGAGDCQALRFENGNWGISPGAAAAPAPLAWPGTAEAVAAGYRAVR